MPTRTITLSDRPPVEIDEEKWPLVARSQYELEFDRRPYRTWRLHVRQHADGRSLVYGTYRLNGEFSERGEDDRKAARVLLDAGADIVRAIRETAEDIAGRADDPVARDLIRECLAQMPADRLD